jgi:para-nitrobenzyl esterase
MFKINKISKPEKVKGWSILGAVGVSLAMVLSLFGSASASPSNNRSSPSSCTRGTRVHTDKGPICGKTKNGVTTYNGVPYAAPPVGKLRWKPPKHHKRWKKTIQATKDFKRCFSPNFPGSDQPAPEMSEDCLYLKVQKPANAKRGENLPVMYELHGGGFLGEAQTDNGEHLVNKGHVIYVYVSYRLGILGFLANRALGFRHAGDYGIQDQQAGLRWVKRNISRFGGNPHNVTIFGESAGGASVCDQVASPTARGLFQKGISVSGFYNYQKDTVWSTADCKSTYYTERQAQRASAKFATKVGCGHGNVAACLRSIPAAKLVEEGGQFVKPKAGGTIGPIINGSTLTMSPKKAFATGHVNHVKLITDVGRDEFNGGVYENYPDRNTVVAESPSQYRRLVRQQFGWHTRAVLRRYPLKRYMSPFVAYRTVMADSASVCPVLKANAKLARHIPVFADINNDADNPHGLGKKAEPLGAVHSGTNALVHFALSELDPSQAALETQLLSEWTHFAHTGNPSASHTPKWPRYGRWHKSVLSLRPAGASGLTATRVIRRRHNCGFWNHITHY